MIGDYLRRNWHTEHREIRLGLRGYVKTGREFSYSLLGHDRAERKFTGEHIVVSGLSGSTGMTFVVMSGQERSFESASRVIAEP